MARGQDSALDLAKLQRMVAIYDAGSFRKAAKDLGMSQPTLTWSVHQLEESLNVRLFERGPRGIRPTAICDRMVRRARLMLREQDRMLADASTTARNQTIELGVHSIFLTQAFARCIAAFAQSWPTVTLRIREGYSSDLVERLLRGELDFACCALPDDAEHGGALRAEPLAVLRYSIVAGADHPIFADIAAGRPAADYAWVEFDTAIVGAFPGNTDMDRLQRNAGRDTGRRSVRTASMSLIKRLVCDGDFIGLIADHSVADELAAGRLKRLPGTTVTASRFGFLQLEEDFETDIVRALKTLLQEHGVSSFAL
jgi:DNA-binding transcriptional LysR family regulator